MALGSYETALGWLGSENRNSSIRVFFDYKQLCTGKVDMSMYRSRDFAIRIRNKHLKIKREARRNDALRIREHIGGGPPSRLVLNGSRPFPGDDLA